MSFDMFISVPKLGLAHDQHEKEHRWPPGQSDLEATEEEGGNDKKERRCKPGKKWIFTH